jgi:hypothetical protein
MAAAAMRRHSGGDGDGGGGGRGLCWISHNTLDLGMILDSAASLRRLRDRVMPCRLIRYCDKMPHLTCFYSDISQLEKLKI